MANTIPPEKIARIREMTERGESLRAIASALDIHTATVRRYRRYFVEGTDLGLCECGRPKRHTGFCHEQFRLRQLTNQAKCGCGEPAFHRGWCWYRFARSPARQATLAKMHGRPVEKRNIDLFKKPKQAQALPWDGIKPLDHARLTAGR